MESRTFVKAISVIGFSMLVLIALAACGGGSGSGNSSGSSSGSSGQSGPTINYQVLGSEDGDVSANGVKHDTFKTADSTTIQRGQRVTLKFTNTDTMPHSYTMPALGINVAEPGAMKNVAGAATYTFTADKTGTFRWFCAIPCDSDNQGWAMGMSQKGMGQDNFMAGYLIVQ